MRTPSWLQATWLRVVAVLAAIVILGYAAIVPTALLYLAIDSRACLGSACGAATVAAVAGGLLACGAAIAGAICAVWFAVRPRSWSALGIAVGAALLPVALAIQVAGLRTLSDGRALGGDAMQFAYAVDTVVESSIVEATGLPVIDQPGVLGPEVDVDLCPSDAGAFIATVRMRLTGAADPDETVRDAIGRGIANSTTRVMAGLANAPLTAAWQQEQDGWVLTVTSACQPMPKG